MTPTVREFRPEDAEAVARVYRAAVPHLVWPAAAVAWQAASAPPDQRVRWLVAEDPGGRVVGCVDTGLRFDSSEPGQGYVHTAVCPDDRGRGAGRALAGAAERYLTGLGAVRAYTWVADDGCSPGFAERRGYVRGRRSHFLGLDLAHAGLPPLPDPLPAGVELRTAADFADDPRPLYEADLECTADEPSDVPAGALPFEDWLRLTWRRPELDPVLTSVVLVDGEVAAYTVAQTDGVDRYSSGMTGTRRAYRARGLATLAKTDSLLRSRAAGYRHAFTGNDAGNAPMLAVNQRLGYRVAAAEWRYVKELPGTR